jgi:hypothetical protein
MNFQYGLEKLSYERNQHEYVSFIKNLLNSFIIDPVPIIIDNKKRKSVNKNGKKLE